AGNLKSMNGFQLSEGWIAGPGVDPASLPRPTEYGGPVEMATYIIGNSGLGQLEGHPHLELREEETDPNFARGRLAIRLKSGDVLHVGVDAMDELVVQYH